MIDFNILIRQASENGLKPAEVMEMSQSQYANYILGQIRLNKTKSKYDRINTVFTGFYAGAYSGNYQIDPPSRIIDKILDGEEQQEVDIEEQRADIKNIILMHKNWK